MNITDYLAPIAFVILVALFFFGRSSGSNWRKLMIDSGTLFNTTFAGKGETAKADMISYLKANQKKEAWGSEATSWLSAAQVVSSADFATAAVYAKFGRQVGRLIRTEVEVNGRKRLQPVLSLKTMSKADLQAMSYPEWHQKVVIGVQAELSRQNISTTTL